MNDYPKLNNDFTRKGESDKIKNNNIGYTTLSDQTPKLSSEQQKNINSAYRAKQGGFITDSQYKNNLAKNGVKTPEIKPPNTNSNQYGVKKTNTTGFKIPNEKLEQERLKNLTGQWDLKKVNQDELENHVRLKHKRPDNYYKEIVDDKEQQKRLDEAFGSKTDFSLSNYENNYDKFNDEEKSMFIHKMQLEFNRQGYRGKDGYRLKTDGILGRNTKKALDDYKNDNSNDYKEAVELKENHIADVDYNEEPLMFTNTNETANKIASVSFKKSITTEEKEEKQSLSDWLEQGSKQTNKNTSAKYITTIITGRLLDAKSKYLDAQKSGNQLEMKIQSEIGKYIKEVLRNVVENSEKIGDKKFGKMFSSSMEYDKNGNNPERSINNWREILKYSDDLAEHEFALVDLINQANGITVKQVDNDITAIRAICNDAYKKGILDNLTFYIGPDIYKGNYTKPYHSYYYTNSDKTTSKLIRTNYPKNFDYTTGQEKESGAGNFLKIFGY